MRATRLEFIVDRVNGAERSTRVAVVAILSVTALLLSTAVALGLAIPTSWIHHGLGDSSRLGYGQSGAQFPALRDNYVRSLLGGAVTNVGLPVEPSGQSSTGGRAPTIEVDHLFTNDAIADAYEVPGVPFRATTDLAGATREARDPIDCSPVGGTGWYRYTPAVDQALLADTFGSSGSMSLGVYADDALTSVGCDTNVLGNAQVGLFAHAGHTYFFQLTPTIAGGPVVFELNPIGRTTIETVSPSGAPPDGPAVEHPEISDGGRFVLFRSYARNLAADPTDCRGMPYCPSLYLRDRVTGTTTRIAVQPSDIQPGSPDDGLAMTPAMSPDGRYIAFMGYIWFRNVPGPAPTVYPTTPDAPDFQDSTYLYDRTTGKLQLTSRNSSGEPIKKDSKNAANDIVIGGGASMTSVSSDGRYVTFGADGQNLDGTDDDGNLNGYRKDLVTGELRQVNIDADGNPMKGPTCMVSGRNVSSDGRRVLFMAAGGEPGTSIGATAALMHVFVWDAATGRATKVSQLPDGQHTAGNYCPAISEDGSHVAFISRDALVPEDTNGTADVYEYDVDGHRLVRVSVTSDGRQTIDPNYAGEDITGVIARGVTLSADGRYAAFDSAAPDLTPGSVGHIPRPGDGTPGPRHIYVHDLVTGATTLVSVSSTGAPLDGENSIPYLSADGSTVAFFNKGASGLVNVFVHELR